MSREMGRDDFVISARSVFLKKRNRQKFSLLTLIITSIIILSLEYFKSGPINQARLITKDIIIKSSYVASIPFKSITKIYYSFIDHLNMYDEYEKLKKEITKLIKESIPDAIVEIKDLMGDNNHYSAKIKSKVFNNLNKIEQHKLVYKSLKGKMGNELHALSIVTEKN